MSQYEGMIIVNNQMRGVSLVALISVGLIGGIVAPMTKVSVPITVSDYQLTSITDGSGVAFDTNIDSILMDDSNDTVALDFLGTSAEVPYPRVESMQFGRYLLSEPSRFLSLLWRLSAFPLQDIISHIDPHVNLPLYLNPISSFNSDYLQAADNYKLWASEISHDPAVSHAEQLEKTYTDAAETDLKIADVQHDYLLNNYFTFDTYIKTWENIFISILDTFGADIAFKIPPQLEVPQSLTQTYENAQTFSSNDNIFFGDPHRWDPGHDWVGIKDPYFAGRFLDGKPTINPVDFFTTDYEIDNTAIPDTDFTDITID